MAVLKSKKSPSVRFTSTAYGGQMSQGKVFVAVVKGSQQNEGKVFGFIKKGAKNES